MKSSAVGSTRKFVHQTRSTRRRASNGFRRSHAHTETIQYSHAYSLLGRFVQRDWRNVHVTIKIKENWKKTEKSYYEKILRITKTALLSSWGDTHSSSGSRAAAPSLSALRVKRCVSSSYWWRRSQRWWNSWKKETHIINSSNSLYNLDPLNFRSRIDDQFPQISGN